MQHEHFNAPRLFVEADLGEGASLPLAPEQANYVGNVMRRGSGDTVLVFNGRDGLWRAEVRPQARRGITLIVGERVRAQDGGPDLHCLFAPLKRARLDYMVQKAVEMGVSRLQPVMTRHTVAERVNLDRMRANAIEAAEQCGILRIPEIGAPMQLARLLESWEASRRLVLCDEGAEVADPVAALALLRPKPGAPPPPCAVLIGPEGGFSETEREALLQVPGHIRLSLGPRILRADTAAVAALALVNAVAGDWAAPGAVRGL